MSQINHLRPDGKYTYTEPVPGSPIGSDVVFPPNGADIEALYHTHAAYDADPAIAQSRWGDRNLQFSNFGNDEGDIPFSDKHGWPNYMADPHNTIHKYDPADPLRYKRGLKGEILGKCDCDNK